ncbi:MFS general substrate transporter [Pyrrhoderma noxium]|uniref:MFS general substrate transporter n=1 Tax=Pyrrhoderma noxium TaxID=2282107 RepID=A0A286UJC5_9AGAM|nr:MFS general substrate transporter [Pyrrhoderma noxium]
MAAADYTPKMDPGKSEVVTIEHKIQEAGECSDDTSEQGINSKRLLRKIDWRIIPWVSLLYCLSYLDRSSIGNAKVPSNICLKYFRPSIWLASIMTLWGVTMMCQGFVRNFGTLFAARWMLGFFESGQFPGIAFYMTCWYRRDEFGLRLAFFSSAVTASGAFNGLLAAAISHMNGLGGKSTWRWLFIIEGIATILVGLCSFFALHDYPDSAKFLSDSEREHVLRRLREDSRLSPTEERFTWKEVRKSFTDWKTWLGALCLIGAGGPGYAFQLFLPTIISELGVTTTANGANILTIPVYVVAFVGACSVGYAADRTKRRGYFSIVLTAIGMVGYTILLLSRSPKLSYFAVYLVACGIYPNGPNAVAWLSNNVEGALKRAISMALLASLNNLTGLISTNIYRANDAPRYFLGHSVSLTYLAIGHVSAIVTHIMLRKENERRDRGERDEVIVGKEGGDSKNGTFYSIEEARKDKGDLWSGFRYII